MLKDIVVADQSLFNGEDIAKGTGIPVCLVKYSLSRCIKIREPPQVMGSCPT